MSDKLEIFTKNDKKYFEPSFDEFNKHTAELAEKLSSTKWKGIIAVTRGGLIPAGLLAYKLNLNVTDTIGLSSYAGVEKQGELYKLKDFDKELIQNDGNGWLLVDDLSDTGKTLNYIKQKLPKAHIVTVYTKPEGAYIVDNNAHEVPQDVWVIFPWGENDDELPEWHERRQA